MSHVRQGKFYHLPPGKENITIAALECHFRTDYNMLVEFVCCLPGCKVFSFKFTSFHFSLKSKYIIASKSKKRGCQAVAARYFLWV